MGVIGCAGSGKSNLAWLGFPGTLAEAVADHVDWHEIAALVHRGCRPRLALNIVL